MPSARRYACWPVVITAASARRSPRRSRSQMKVAYIVVGDVGREFHLEGDDLAVRSLNDEVDFVVSVLSSQVMHGGVDRLRVDANGQRDE